MSKSLLAVALMAILAFTLGVSKCDMSDPLQSLALKNAARSLGYAVAQSKTSADDKAIEAAYELYTKGTVNEVIMTDLIKQLKAKNPLVVFAALDVVEAMGGILNKQQETIIDIGGISHEAWALVETAYKQGYQLGKADKRAGVTRSVP